MVEKKTDWAERNTRYRVKRKSGKLNVTAKACARRETVIIRNMSTIQERPAVPWIKGKNSLRSRPHPAKFTRFSAQKHLSSTGHVY